MTQAKLRPVKLWNADVAYEEKTDGTMYVWQREPLGPVSAKTSDWIEHWAREASDRTWITERGVGEADWRGVTYGEARGLVRAIGQALLDLGLSEDRPLVILSGNSVAHALMVVGAHYVGIPSAAIAPAYSLVSEGFEKLKGVRDQITPGAVFCEDTGAFAKALDAVFPDLPRLGVSGDDLARSWESLTATHVTAAVDEANAAITPDTVAKFLFTSGTTGSPKAVIQTQRMLCVNIEQVTDCYAYLRDEPPMVLDWAPWNHVAAGNLIFNVVLYNGGTFHIDAGRPTKDMIHETIRNLREVRTNWYWNVPAGFEMIIHEVENDPDFAHTFFSDMKLMYYAGAAMAQHTWDDLKAAAMKATGEEILLGTGLGATETAPFALYQAEPQDSPGNIGIPAKDLVLKLVPNEGKMEARVKGPNVTPGYWRNEGLSADAFDEEGFYKLGDALRFAVPGDPTKGFFFDGRVAENFKLQTGTWVSVGAVRAKLTDALGGLARDVVLTGDGEEKLGALIVPFRPAIEGVVDGGKDMDDATLFADPALAAAISARLAAYNAKATGSSMRVPLALILTEPLDLDKGEVTDKGSVNQRAVLRERADVVQALYGEGDGVIHSGK
ncbi:feruloyl-CoA synthase [Maritimibacter sp. UBA3975]|uniref:feruloyl-CoA synthase n=1 Tax=Maritimibacter sp. UBA3975 TaxID=1946833 RepID=UPI000C095BB2|nr:feruloyl-CoA synthase [Maritimibacter sp. UBA3975]MAM63525.1 feruloyl-CoA synthase [Maritimibacter sp.]|tara:strand:- start:82059 stop:83891 length:1833 start_codon:yes stop_codon:yes gene_type:complete